MAIRDKGGSYAEDKYLHSFIGFFPAYDPKFIVFLYTYDPKGVNYASETLAKPFIDLSKYLINYYQLTPDRGSDDMVIEHGTTTDAGLDQVTASSSVH